MINAIKKKLLKGHDNIEVVNHNGEQIYLAHGQVNYANQISDIVTAIRGIPTEQGPMLEFNTNVGQLRDDYLSLAVLGELNHKFNPKFVAIENNNPGMLDVICTSQAPAEWINNKNLLGEELEMHAETFVLSESVIDEANRSQYDQIHTDATELRNFAYNLVQSKLLLLDSANPNPPQYLPKLIDPNSPSDPLH